LRHLSDTSLFYFSLSRSCLLCSRKRKAEPTAMTPAKVLKAGAALMIRTPADATAWVARYQAATERLKAKESTVKAGASA
jgi:hypothetical protein